jgi:hypothetical protein
MKVAKVNYGQKFPDLPYLHGKNPADPVKVCDCGQVVRVREFILQFQPIRALFGLGRPLNEKNGVLMTKYG